jgi:hypothetical protein
MKNPIKIDGTDDNIWHYPGAKISFIITILNAIKCDLELNNTCIITLPTYAGANTNDVVITLKDLIIDFEDNFNTTIINNIIQITRIDIKESYKPQAFQD